MIRTLLMLWLGPIVFFWTWYWLSLNDISLGMHFFSRELHDQMFGIYAMLLGVAPDAVPPMIAKALALDSLVVLGIVAFRRRGPILAVLGAPRTMAGQSSLASLSKDSLSKAP